MDDNGDIKERGSNEEPKKKTLRENPFEEENSLDEIVELEDLSEANNERVVPDGSLRKSEAEFNNCDKLNAELKSLETPDGVAEIKDENNVNTCVDNVIFSKDGRTLIRFSAEINIENYRVPEGVTTIGYAAFEGCSALKSIKIPEGVTEIKYRAFAGCSSLTSIEIPGSVTTIGDDAFSGCSALTSIVIPGSVRKIGDRAFSHCSALTSLVIPRGVTKIGCTAFWRCSALTSIVIPGSATTIGSWAFDDCKQLTICAPEGSFAERYAKENRINFELFDLFHGGDSEEIDAAYSFWADEDDNEERLSSDGKTLFRAPMTTKNRYVVPKGATEIGRAAFCGCSALKEIVVPEGVTAIGDYAFLGCSSLISIEIPEGVTKIENNAFSGCSALNKIVIPGSVKAIGNNAFSRCSSLTTIVIPEGVTTIENGAFSGCSALKSIKIPECVTTIGGSAFEGCSSLTSVVIPEGVEGIGWGAFEGCSALKEIEIPESVTTIGGSAFEGCSSLTSVVIPEGVTTIGDAAFFGCSTLKEIVIPESVTKIGRVAFWGCSALTSIEVAEKNPVYCAVDNVIFSKDRKTLVQFPSWISIENYRVPESVTAIGKGAFFGCSTLTSIEIPEGATEIGAWAFGGCSSLTSIEIPASVREIGADAFAHCSALTSIKIPEGVMEIGRGAFEGCSALKSIIIPEGVTKIGYSAFEGCSSLKSIEIPESVTKIGYNAFEYCQLTICAPKGSYAEEYYHERFDYDEVFVGMFYESDSTTSIQFKPLDSSDDASNDDSPDADVDSSSTLIPVEDELLDDNGERLSSDGKTLLRAPTKAEGCYVVPESVTTIGDAAFEGCSALNEIVIPEGVTKIGYSAFEGCSSLKSIVIPESVDKIDSEAFKGCKYLTINALKDSYAERYALEKRIPFKPIVDKDQSNNGEVEPAENSNSDPVDVPICHGETCFQLVFQPDADFDSPTELITIEDSIFDLADDDKELSDNDLLGSDDDSSSTLFSSEDSVFDLTDSSDLDSDESHDFYEDNAFYNAYGDALWKSADGASSTPDFSSPSSDVSSVSWDGFDSDPFSDVLVIEAKGINRIGTGKYFGQSSLTSVVVPDGIKVVGRYAFAECKSLTSITLPKTLERIEEGAFLGCVSLKSVVVPQGVKKIGRKAFNYCVSLETIDIPNSVKEIEFALLYRPSWLIRFFVSKELQKVGFHAFEGCERLTIRAPKGSYAEEFANKARIKFEPLSPALEEDSFPLDEIFDTSDKLLGDNGKTLLKAPTKTKGCYVVPKGVTRIGDFAFRGCSALKSIKIPKSVTKIGNRAFWGCSALKSIKIPKSVTTIGEEAFGGCSALKSIEVAENNPVYCAVDNVIFSKDRKTLVQFPAGINIENYGVPESVTTIGDYAFRDCSSLTSVVIQEGVTEIGDAAFRGCSALKSIKIPKSVTTIGEEAFWGCSALKSIKIPKSVTTIGYRAFSRCSALKEIVVPESVTEIGNYAFEGCSALTSIVIPGSVTEIGNYAFQGCSALKSVTICNRGAYVEDDAFSSCENFLIKASKVSYAAHWAKKHKIRLELLNTQNEQEDLDEGAIFSDDGKTLVKVPSTIKGIYVVPDRVKRIGSHAFEAFASGDSLFNDYDRSLKGVIIPDSVTEIDRSAFASCRLTIYAPKNSAAERFYENYRQEEFENAEYWETATSYVYTPSTDLDFEPLEATP